MDSQTAVQKIDETAGEEALRTAQSSLSQGLVEPLEKHETGPGVSHEDWKATRATYAIISVIMLLALMSAIDATSVATGLEVIVDQIGGTTAQAIWANSAFLLTSAVFQPIIGTFSDIFGRRPLAIFTVIFFAVGSIMGGVAQNMNVLIAGRAVQGVGGGGCLVLAEIIITDLVPLRIRGKYYGYLGMMWALGTVLGPLLGGGFASNASWRWIFYINLPLCGISLVAIVFLLNLHLEESSMEEKLAKIDYVGLTLFTAANTSVLLGISFGGIIFPWKSWHTLVPLILGGVAIIALSVYEFKVPAVPIVNTKVFANRSASIGYVQVCLHGIIMYLVLYYLPVYYQGSKGYSAITSGVALFPECLTIAPMAVACGITVAILGKYLILSYIGWAIMVLGCGILHLLTYKSSVGQFIGINIPFGIGAGILFVSLNSSVMAPNDPSLHGQSAAVLSFIRTMGQAFGTAIGGAVFANRLSENIGKHPSLAGYGSASDAIALVEVLRKMPPSSTKTLLRGCLDDSMHLVFTVATVFAAVGFLLNLVIKEYSMDLKLQSKQKVIEKVKEEDPATLV